MCITPVAVGGHEGGELEEKKKIKLILLIYTFKCHLSCVITADAHTDQTNTILKYKQVSHCY